MSIGTCKECGTLTQGLVRGLCHECIEAHNTAFDKVRHFFRTTRGATAQRCSDETGVSLQQIMGWIAEGRLTVAHGLTSEEIAASMRENEKVTEIRKAFAEQAGAQAAQVATEFQRRRQGNGMHGRTL